MSSTFLDPVTIAQSKPAVCGDTFVFCLKTLFGLIVTKKILSLPGLNSVLYGTFVIFVIRVLHIKQWLSTNKYDEF